MAQILTNRARIARLCRKKQANEQLLGKRLADAFSQREPLTQIRLVVQNALEAMCASTEAAIYQSTREAAHVGVWAKTSCGATPAGARELLSKLGTAPQQFGLTDLSETMVIVELWSRLPDAVFHGVQVNEIRQSYQRGVLPSGPVPGAPGWAGDRWERESRAIWNRDPAKGKVTRDRGPGWEIERHIRSNFRPQPRGSKVGMQLKRSRGASGVLRIDRLFGLLVGADISGTTVETVFAVEVWGARAMHPIYYLYVVPALLYNCHHTLLEIALSLSLNGVIDYRIGYYTTLLPPGGVPSCLACVPNILVSAQEDPSNQHLVCWYEGPTVAGAILFDLCEEKHLLRSSKLFRATEMLAQAQTIGAYPTQAEVRALLQRQAPELVGRVPGW